MPHLIDAPLTATPGLAALTKRELEVLTLITQGLSNDEIARELYVTGNTVKSFVRGAYRKIGVTRRPQAVIWGFQHGLMEEAA